MFNNFVIVGPNSDPAKIKSVSNVKLAFEKIFNGKFNFISRSDNSGTHKAEEKIWKDTGLNPILDKEKWYIQAGQGMGATLNMAVNFNAYIFTDKSNWISFKNKRHHKILFDYDPSLLNNYSVITIDKKICPKSKTKLAENFSNWLVSSEGQSAIESYSVDNLQLYFVKK